MTDDLKTLLDRASDFSPRAFDTDGVVARGRRRSRRHRLGLAAGGMVGAAAVTLVTITLTSTLVVGIGKTPPVTAGQPRPDYTLPQLDPSADYYWSSSGREDDAVGAQLTGAIADYFAQHFPTAKVIRYGPEVEDDGQGLKPKALALTDAQSPFRFSRYTNRLVLWQVDTTGRTPPTIVHQEPVYRLWNNGSARPEDDAGGTLDHLSGAQLALDGSGQNQTDYLRFALFPSGGYQPGHDPAMTGMRQPSDGYLVEGCATYDVTDAHAGTGDDRRFSFDCTESAGPNGERIVAVAAHESYLNANAAFTINTVVVYRTDGTAVVVGDTARPGLDFKQGRSSVSGTPGLSLAALTGLALAVPLVTIP